MLFALQYRKVLPCAKKTAREMRYSRKRGKSRTRGAKGTGLRIYERAGDTDGGSRRRRHCIRILCKGITSDYARLSANRITSLLFARRQAVDLVNSNSALSRAESPTEQRFPERFLLSYSLCCSSPTRLNIGLRKDITLCVSENV